MHASTPAELARTSASKFSKSKYTQNYTPSGAEKWLSPGTPRCCFLLFGAPDSPSRGHFEEYKDCKDWITYLVQVVSSLRKPRQAAAQRTKTQGSPQDFWTMEGPSKGPNCRRRHRCHRHRDHIANCFFNDSAGRDSNATAISGAPTPPQSLPAPDAPQSEPFHRSATGRLGHSSFPETRTEPHL